MAHGYPDWAQSAGVNTVYQLRDLAELAARLGSIDTFDRRGDVFFLWDFESGAESFGYWGGGAGWGTYLSLLYPKSGHLCFALKSGSNGSQNAYMFYRSHIPSESRLGFESSVCGGSVKGQIVWWLLSYDGERCLTTAIKYDHNTDKLYYYSTDSDWIEFASGINLGTVAGAYNTAKLVVDLPNKKYVRFMLGSNCYDLSDIDGLDEALVVYPQTYSQIEFYGEAGFNNVLYVDDWILTQNEP